MKDTNNADMSKTAIIGMALRVPGARTPDDFWSNLRQGVESIVFFHDDELKAQGIDERILGDSNYVKAYGYLPDSDHFDADFFDMPASEAGLLDPQHRVFLECCWGCLEDAGYAGEHDLTVGVFGGIGLNYQHLSYLYQNFDELTTRFGSSMAVEFGMRSDFIASRVSYLLNLRGPSMTVQCACSTSLVSVHMAAQSILNGECDMALAGGLTINLTNKTGYYYTPGSIQSPDGHCRAFDAEANGTVGGNGGGVVLLKSFVDAIKDRDHIYGVILGSSVKNDGSLKVGFTAPSVVGQADTIAEAISVAGIEADSIGYVEAHGTATRLGDPIEISALSRAFRETTKKKGFCAIGSVKTNLGHLDAGAGVTGLIKAALSLENREIPPSLHYQQPNSEIDFDETPFFVNTELRPWEGNGSPLRAGASSFGIGGTNAHIILEEAPAVQRSRNEPGSSEILLLSAKTELALDRACSNLETYLGRASRGSLADVAHTLRVGRKAFPHRRALVCQNGDEAIGLLSGSKPGLLSGVASKEANTSLAFLFSGQGSQYSNMGRGLFEAEPVYRATIEECSALLEDELGKSLRDLLYPRNAEASAVSERSVHETCFAQPLLFSVGYALAQLWRSWGIHPQAMIGHSIGELTAACLSGVFSLPDALRVVAARGRFMQEMPRGAMLATPLPKERLEEIVATHAGASIAALNAPDSSVLSGPAQIIQKIQAQLEAEGVSSVVLETSHAFHSSMMDPVLKRFEAVVRSTKMNEPRIPFVSCLTGGWISKAQAQDPHYWAQQIRSTVRFDEGLQSILEDGKHLLIEMGPGSVLTKLTRRNSKRENAQLVVPSLAPRGESNPQSEVSFLLTSLAQLWLSGARFDWRRFRDHATPKRVPLPTYPFEQRRFAIPSGSSKKAKTTGAIGKGEVDDWFYMPTWKRVSPARGLGAEASDFHWLILRNDSPLSDAFASVLNRDTSNVTTVRFGSEFKEKGGGEFVIHPSREADYAELARALSGFVEKPVKVVHFATLSDDFTDSIDDDRFTQLQEIGFYSLLFLARELSQCEFPGDLDLTVVSNRLHDVWGDGRIDPEKATMNGLVLCLPQEKPRTSARCIDVECGAHAREKPEALADSVLAEILRGKFDRMVALRNRHRWVASYEPVELEAREPGESRVRQGDVCLITGGLGNIGLTVALYLAQTFNAKIALVGRTGLPPSGEWDSYPARNDADPRTLHRIEKVRAIQSAGTNVMIVEADACDEKQMGAAVDSVERELGDVQVVFHAAAHLDQALKSIDDSDKKLCETQFGAKARGAITLARIFRDRSAHSFVLFSSISSALGGLGYTAYAASNLFLDALAGFLNGESEKKWISINWDAWNFAANEESGQPLLGQELASLALKPQEGSEALNRILASDLLQVVVSTGELKARIKKWVRLEAPKKKAPRPIGKRATAENGAATPLQYDEDFKAPRTTSERLVAELWMDLLESDRISIDDDFLSLGGNSLFLITFLDKAKQLTGVSLTIMQAAGSLEEIAALIDESKKKSVKGRLRSLLDSTTRIGS